MVSKQFKQIAFVGIQIFFVNTVFCHFTYKKPSIAKKLDIIIDLIKSNDKSNVRSHLSDYTLTNNNIKKSVKFFVKSNVTQSKDKLIVDDIPKVNFFHYSGSRLYFVRNQHGNLISVVKIFNNPFNNKGLFLRNLVGFKIGTHISAKHFQIIRCQSVGRCVVDGEEYGMIAMSPASGIEIQKLIVDLLHQPRNSQKRISMLQTIQKAMEKLGNALAELHQLHIRHNVLLDHSIIKNSHSLFANMIHLLKDNDYGIDSEKLRSYFNFLIQKIQSVKLNATVSHGDAQLGNFLYDQYDNTVYMIDLESMDNSVSRKNGHSIGNGAVDFMEVVELINMNKKFGLSTKEADALTQSFYQGYGNLPTELEQEFFYYYIDLNLQHCFYHYFKKILIELIYLK